jgi:hypothetical protein
VSAAEPVRVTAPSGTFEAWRAMVPGVAVPAGLEPPVQATGPLMLPTAVATAFAVYGEAETVVTLRVSRGELRLAAHGAVVGDLAAVVVQVRHAEVAATLDWAQVVLLPGDQVPKELLGWLPGLPISRPAGQHDRPGPSEALLSVIVTRRAVDGRRLSHPTSSEIARWASDCAGLPSTWFCVGGQVRPGELRTALRATLLGRGPSSEGSEDR